MAYIYQDRVTCLIWTYNPNINLLRKVIQSVNKTADHIVIVDNGSSNVSEIRKLAKKKPHIHCLFLKYNSGVHALNVGIDYIISFLKPKYILVLDQDSTLVQETQVQYVLKTFDTLLSRQKKIAAIFLNDHDESYERSLLEITHPRRFSGMIIHSDVIIRENMRIREDFFLDQADFDLFSTLKGKGYKLLTTGMKLINHKVGISDSCLESLRKRIIIRRFSSPGIEPLWRFYYVVRNSTVLLIERRIKLTFYLFQLLRWAITLFLCSRKKLKIVQVIIKGLTDGLFKRLGYLPHEKAYP